MPKPSKIAAVMVSEIAGDNGCRPADVYKNAVVMALLEGAINANKPTIETFSKHDLEILAYGDMEEQVCRDGRDGEQELADADRQKVLLAKLPAWAPLNAALESVFEAL